MNTTEPRYFIWQTPRIPGSRIGMSRALPTLDAAVAELRSLQLDGATARRGTVFVVTEETCHDTYYDALEWLLINARRTPSKRPRGNVQIEHIGDCVAVVRDVAYGRALVDTHGRTRCTWEMHVTLANKQGEPE